jgi:ECF transporter S component (folate family)
VAEKALRKESTMKKNVSLLAFMALFVTLEVILTRFLSIQTPILRIGFAYLPLAVSAMMLGPIYGGVAAAVADVVGMMLFPSGAYFPGFTLSAFLSGVGYGIFTVKRKDTLHIAIGVLLVSILVNLVLDTVWLWMITGQGYLALLPVRVVKIGIMIPIQIATIKIIWRYAVSRVNFRPAA